MNHKIELIAIDLDGTLLNSSKQISSRCEQTLRQAVAAGVRVVLATARPPRSAMRFYEQLDLDTPTINYNGALVFDPQDNRVLMHRPIPLAVARKIVTMGRQVCPEVLVSAEVLDQWFTDRVDDRYTTETGRLMGPDVVGPIDQWLSRAVTKLLFLGEADRLTEIGERIHARLPHQVSTVQTEDNLLQVMHATVSKAQALRTVAAELAVRQECVMAIGDNANDVGMLQWAQVGVAVGNAAPSALAVADVVVGRHDDDGVAEAVRKLVLRA